RESYVLQLPQSQKIRKTALRSCRISAPANGRSTKAHHDKPITQRSPQGGGEHTDFVARSCQLEKRESIRQIQRRQRLFPLRGFGGEEAREGLVVLVGRRRRQRARG